MAELKEENSFDPDNAERLRESDIPEDAKGKWIAIHKGSIITKKNSELEAYQSAKAKADTDNFLITKIPEDSKARVL